MTTFETLAIERDGGVAVVRLDRPPVNAVNGVMRRELRTCFDELSQDRGIGAVVLSATGKVFCGGVDLRDPSWSTPPGPDADVHAVLDSGWEWRSAQHAIRHCSVPVIAAVDGACIGAGFGLVGVSDLIIASGRASFGLTEINVGALGGSSKALRLVGSFKARKMFFSGEMEPASELYRLGAIEELTADGEAEAKAIELGRTFAKKSPIGLRLAKESLLRIEGDLMESQYRTEQDYSNRLRNYDDSGEARAAWAEKREPSWGWK